MSSSSSSINLCQLPDVTLNIILDHLSYYDLLNIRSVCHKLNTGSLAALRRKRVIRISTNSGSNIGLCELFEYDICQDSYEFDLILNWSKIDTSTHHIVPQRYMNAFAILASCHCPFVRRFEISIADWKCAMCFTTSSPSSSSSLLTALAPSSFMYPWTSTLIMLLHYWRQTLTHVKIMGKIVKSRNNDDDEIQQLVDCIKQLPKLTYLSMPINLFSLLRPPPVFSPTLEHINIYLAHNIPEKIFPYLTQSSTNAMMDKIRSFGIWIHFDCAQIDKNILHVIWQQNNEWIEQKLTRLSMVASNIVTTRIVLSHCRSLTYLWLDFNLFTDDITTTTDADDEHDQLQQQQPLNALLCIIADSLKQLHDLRIYFTNYQVINSLNMTNVQFDREWSLEPQTSTLLAAAHHHRLPSVRSFELYYPVTPKIFPSIRSLFEPICSIAIWYLNDYTLNYNDDYDDESDDRDSNNLANEFKLTCKLLCKQQQQSSPPSSSMNHCIHNCVKLHQVMNDYCNDDDKGSNNSNIALRATIAPDGTIQHGEIVNWNKWNRFEEKHFKRFLVVKQ